LDEAKALLKCNFPSGAFHLAGIALELAIKACLATRFDRHVIPDKKFVTDIYTHDLKELIKTAGLSPDLKRASNEVQQNWETVKAWTIESRYDFITDEDAQGMIAAVSEPPNGVFAWIQMHW
jgi:hypothetical protein